jgi:hypothetical protein
MYRSAVGSAWRGARWAVAVLERLPFFLDEAAILLPDVFFNDVFLGDDDTAAFPRLDDRRALAPASVTAKKQSRRMEQKRLVVRNPLFYRG